MKASRAILTLLALVLASGPSWASDNSKSSLQTSDLLVDTGDPPLPITLFRPKPPSLQALKQQLAADEQVLANQQAGLAMAQSELAFWQGPQPPQLQQINLPQWTQAVASDQHTIATVQAQINQLLIQIAAL